MAGGHWLNSESAAYWQPGFWVDAAANAHWPEAAVISAVNTEPTIASATAHKEVTRTLMDGFMEPGSSTIIFGP